MKCELANQNQENQLRAENFKETKKNVSWFSKTWGFQDFHIKRVDPGESHTQWHSNAATQPHTVRRRQKSFPSSITEEFLKQHQRERDFRQHLIYQDSSTLDYPKSIPESTTTTHQPFTRWNYNWIISNYLPVWPTYFSCGITIWTNILHWIYWQGIYSQLHFTARRIDHPVILLAKILLLQLTYTNYYIAATTYI